MNKLDYIYTTYDNKKMGFLFEDMCLTEAHFFSCPENEPKQRTGEICTAVVDKVIPAIDGAFLIGPEQTPLFLRLSDMNGREILLRKRKKGNVLVPGDVLLVQISAEAQKKKQYEATVNISLNGSYVILNRTGTIGISRKITDPEERERLQEILQDILKDSPEFGVIVRTSAKDAAEEVLREETSSLLSRLKDLIKRAETTPEYKVLYRPELTPEAKVREILQKREYEAAAIHTDLDFDASGIGLKDSVVLHRITEKEGSPLVTFNIPVLLEKALARKVFLKDGGYLYIERTEAMTVIDVNSGKSIRGKDHEEQALKENCLAADEIARLLRLRNISGIIIVDFISMRDEESNRELLKYLRRVVAQDSVDVHVVDMTRLGLVEMTRRKKDAPLEEQLDFHRRS